MRNVAFLALGLGLLVLQANVFRLIDGASPWLAALLVVAALAADVARTIRQGRGTPGRPGAVTGFRGDWVLPALVLFAYTATAAFGHPRFGRPIPALVLPVILFMGVH